INMNAYMEARRLTQSFIDDFLGYFIDPKNKQMSSLLVGSGLPGGMMGSLMADLKGAHNSINNSLKANNQPEKSEDEMLVWLFEEVGYIWPKLGYPPLVTPFSQYVKNIALMNILQMVQGKERYTIIDNNSWNMILGTAGQLPGPLAPEIIEIAKQEGKEFYQGVPQDAFPDALETYKKEMVDKKWEFGTDEEELFELAMHDRQYRDYKSGVAKQRFFDELERVKKQATTIKSTETAEPKKEEKKKPTLIDDKKYKLVKVKARGKIFYSLGYLNPEPPVKLNDKVKKGQRLAYVFTNYGTEEILSEFTGKVVNILIEHTSEVQKGDVIMQIDDSKK
ncbi:MAG: hypothetical protein JW866_04285, partial [Ignavibacteriales bacterium]|nr:hypothetical protein [Ignavibacteriales bacterium]